MVLLSSGADPGERGPQVPCGAVPALIKTKSQRTSSVLRLAGKLRSNQDARTERGHFTWSSQLTSCTAAGSSPWMARFRRAGASSVLILLLITVSCSRSSGTRPVSFCGQTLYSGAQGFEVQSLKSLSGRTHIAVGQVLLLKLTDSCSSGYAVQLNPSGGAMIFGRVVAHDGGVTAIALRIAAPGMLAISAHTPSGSGYQVVMSVG